MLPVSRVYLDANIFIQIFEGVGLLRDRVFDIFDACKPGGQTFLATSELTFAETIVDPYRRKNEELIQLYDNWTVSNAFLEVGPVNRDVLYAAAVLRADNPGFKLPDAIHVATAMLFRCSHFLTSDKRLKGICTLDHVRSGLTPDIRNIEFMHPDETNLAALHEQARQR